MRHRKSGRQLNRNSSHRKAMFKNMACSLIEHEVIKTTVPKAKELRRVAEPLITLAKSDSVANRRLAFARTGSKDAVGKLVDPQNASEASAAIEFILEGLHLSNKLNREVVKDRVVYKERPVKGDRG